MRSAVILASALALTRQAVAGEPDTVVQGRQGSILGSPGQVERDAKTVRIFGRPEVKAAIDELDAYFRSDPVARMPDAESTLRRAAEAMAMAQTSGVVGADPDRPEVVWGTAAQHHWGDLQVPLAGVMIDNPDNIYRTIPIDGAASYLIRGRVYFAPPVQQTLILHNEKSGASRDQKVKKQENEDGAVSLDTLPVARDGTFTVTVDKSAVGNRLNHIQSDPQVRGGYILVRDTMSDWSRQNPVELSVERVSGPPVQTAPGDAELARRAAEMTGNVGRYFFAWLKQRFYSGQPNTFTHEFERKSGWGFVKCGYYRLEPGEALLVELDRREAAYLGFQLSDAWGQGQALEYIRNLGSLTGDQAKANPDASYTYVISGDDPGVYNWLDTGGLRTGTYCARWQKVPDGVTATGAVRAMKVIALSDLKNALPAETVWVTPEQRRAQLEQRAKDYARRLQY